MAHSQNAKVSCGILLYKTQPQLQVLLVHPGGPFWKNKQTGAWTIPKGLQHAEEDLLDTAIREFEEETGFKPHPPFMTLGSVKQKGGKTVYCWAAVGELDAATIKSNVMKIEWPYKSGKWMSVPEVDEARWCLLDEAKKLINPAQADFLDLLTKKLESANS